MKVKHLLKKYANNSHLEKKDNIVRYTIYYGRRTKVKGQNIIRDYNVFTFSCQRDIPDILRKGTVSSFKVKDGTIEITAYERPYCGKS